MIDKTRRVTDYLQRRITAGVEPFGEVGAAHMQEAANLAAETSR